MESAPKSLQLLTAGMATGIQQEVKSSSPPVAEPGVNGHEKKAILSGSHKLVHSREQDAGKTVGRTHLINKINYLNFQDLPLLVNFKHLKYKKTLSLYAHPRPCRDAQLDCRWIPGENVLARLKSYAFSSLLITSGNKLLQVEAELIQLDKTGIRLLLPETAREISSRAMARHAGADVSCQVIQNGSLFSGKLVDFNARSLKIKLVCVPPQTFEWINPESAASIILSNGADTLYSGQCRIIRHTPGGKQRTYIFQPLKQEIQRFKHKEYRSNRYELTPTPNIVFRHPLINKMFDLKVIDISGSGFAVEEDNHNSVLLPGMILPELTLSFAGSFKVKCRAQVVYRKTVDEGKRGTWIKCGLTLLDMQIEDHVKLISLLQQTKDRNAYVCNHLDLDALWDFFFETGFIYPDKYAFIQKNKQHIKKTYEKLYRQTPQIARHFVYQQKGSIQAHMAMIRFYKNTWLIHHHAARKSALNKAGLIVLDQIGRMINNSYRLHSLHMDYMMCYFRPDNKFPSRVFGGAARTIKDPAGCSIDNFAYFHHPVKSAAAIDLSPSWELTETVSEDLQELESFYEQVSGGLMTRALNLQADSPDFDELAAEYRQLGLKMQHQFFALKKAGRLKAVIIVNQSDLGLNLSELTNGTQIIVVEPEELTAGILNAAVAKVAALTRQWGMPVLLYPVDYADRRGLTYDKIYSLWIFNLQYLDPYFKYVNRLLRFV